jgi:hypothetical protein
MLDATWAKLFLFYYGFRIRFSIKFFIRYGLITFFEQCFCLLGPVNLVITIKD